MNGMRIYFNNEIEDVNVGDEVITTTSTFDYDNVAGTFASDLNAYADVKENWALIKSHDFEQALANLKKWVQMTDNRYDGENWNE